MTVQQPALVQYRPPRRSILTRIAAWFRAAPVQAAPKEFDGGATAAGDTGVRDDYPTEASMSAMAAFPFVRAALFAKVQDISGLPVVVKDRKGSVKTDGPMVRLLEQPASRTMWRWFIAQMVLDFELTGDAFAVLVGGPSVYSLHRLHPNATSVVPENDMQIAAYSYDAGGKEQRYAWETVLHVRGQSWQDGVKQLVGEGAIRCLHETLSADLAARKQRKKTSRRGHFDFVVSPEGRDGASSQLSPQNRQKVADGIDEMAEEGRSALVLGVPMKVTPISATPQQMQQAELERSAREDILAVFQVPPTRVGLPGANYATQRQESKTYWESLIHGPIAAFADALTWLARTIGDPGDRIEFDTSDVESLQEGKTERLRRVTQHILNGVSPADAYEVEGFLDIAQRVRTQGAQQTPPEPPRAATRAAPTRDEVWRAFIRDLHEPIEKAGRQAVQRMLAAQAERYAERIAEELAKEGVPARSHARISVSVVDAILANGAEQTAMAEAMRRWFAQSFERSVRSEIRRLGIDISFDPTAAPVDELVSAFVTNVGPTTAEAVRQIVESGVANGATIAEIQRALIDSRAFAPDRALAIARTETTGVVGRGQEVAHQAAIAHGVRLRKEWLTARDGAVRESHRRMDGQIREIGEDFVDPVTGAAAPHPGAFDSAAQNVNCRCTTLPVVED